MRDIKNEGKSLDLFYGLSAADQIQRQRSGMSLLNQLCSLNRSDKEAFTRMAEYTLSRLIRAHSSSNLQTRGYMFTALTGILRVCNGIENEFVVGLIEKNLAVEEDDTKSIKLNKRVAGILTCGALLHSRNIKNLEKEILEDLIRRISQNAISKQIFMEYATPFFVELFEKAFTQLKRKRKEKLFNDVILPAMAPFVEKMKLPQNNFVHLRVALALQSAKIEGFEDFLRDQNTVVKTIMANDLLGDKEFQQLFGYYSSSEPSTIDGFWTLFTEALSSSHFGHLCALIEACSKNYSITAALNEKVLNSLYYTIKSIKMKQHKSKAVATMTTIVKWLGSSKYFDQCPDDRIIAIQRLFSGDQHILQQYKELAVPLKHLTMSLNEAELAELTSACLKLMDGDKVSTRLCITVVNYLAKIAQNSKLSTEVRSEIVKRIVTVGKAKPISEEVNETNDLGSQEQPENEIETDDVDDMLLKCRVGAFRSILSATYNIDLMAEILKNPEILDELKPKELSHEYKEAVKKARKLLKVGKKDPHLYYVIGTYTLYLYLDAAAALPVIDELTELCANRKNPEDSKEAAEIIVKLVLSKILHEQQPLINYHLLFNRLMAKNLLDDDLIKSMADAIEVSTEESEEDDDDDDDDDEDEDSDSDAGDTKNDNEANGEGSDDDEEDEESDEEEEKTEASDDVIKIDRPENADEDSDASMDLDDAPEQDLQRLDQILAMAAKKKSNNAGEKELQYTMRVKRLLKSVVRRRKSTPLGEMLKKKIRLV